MPLHSDAGWHQPASLLTVAFAVSSRVSAALCADVEPYTSSWNYYTIHESLRFNQVGPCRLCVAPPVASVTLPPSESRTCLSLTLLVVGSIRKQRNKLVSPYFYISTAQVETFGHTVLPAWVGPARCGDADLPKGPSGRLLAQREEVEEAEFPGLRWYVQVCSWSDFSIPSGVGRCSYLSITDFLTCVHCSFLWSLYSCCAWVQWPVFNLLTNLTDCHHLMLHCFNQPFSLLNLSSWFLRLCVSQ